MRNQGPRRKLLRKPGIKKKRKLKDTIGEEIVWLAIHQSYL